MSRLRQLILIILSVWATLATAQEDTGRDLLFKPGLPDQGEPAPLYVEFRPGKYDLAGLSPQGKAQLEQVFGALGTPVWKDRVVIIEAQACSRTGSGEDRPGARQRAEVMRDLILNRQLLAPERVFMVVRGPRDGESDEEHVQYQWVLIRPWDQEQMADLAAVMVPSPPAGCRSGTGHRVPPRSAP